MRDATTRREVMALGLSAAVLNSATHAAGEEAAGKATKVGHHFHNGLKATIHVVGTGFNPAATTTVTLKGKFGTTDVGWTPATILEVKPNRIKVESIPSWTAKEDDQKRGIGTLTVTVTNDGSLTTPSSPESHVSYE
jgi:hypothetical protein